MHFGNFINLQKYWIACLLFFSLILITWNSFQSVTKATIKVTSESCDEKNEEVSGTIPSLPSLRSLDDVDISASYSGSRKRNKSKISKIFKNIKLSLKS